MQESGKRSFFITHRVWLLVVILAVGAIAWFFVRRGPDSREAGKAAAQAPHSVPIQTTTVRAGDIGVSIQALGTVTPVYTVSVTSRVQGEIAAVNYKEGQLVRKGDSLIEIDPRPYEAALLQAEGQLKHDQAVLKQAQIDLVRYRRAFAQNAIAKQQLDDQEQIVVQDEGTVKADQGVLDNAKVNLDYTHIRSPIEGRVGLRLVDPGNIVQANGTTVLVVVTQLRPITVIFSVAEDYLSQIQDQLKRNANMIVEAYDRSQTRKIATGKFLTLDNLIDTTTGTVRIRATFENEDDSLFPNQFVNARLLLETLKGVTIVSSPAIQRNAQGPFVYVIRSDQTAEMRNVQVGTAEGDVSQVQGIKPGETVALSGFDKLQEGAKVSVRNEVAGSAAKRGEIKP